MTITQHASHKPVRRRLPDHGLWGNINANITGFDIRNGNVVFSDTRSGQILATPAVSNGHLYIADGDEVVAYAHG